MIHKCHLNIYCNHQLFFLWEPNVLDLLKYHGNKKNTEMLQQTIPIKSSKTLDFIHYWIEWRLRMFWRERWRPWHLAFHLLKLFDRKKVPFYFWEDVKWNILIPNYFKVKEASPDRAHQRIIWMEILKDQKHTITVLPPGVNCQQFPNKEWSLKKTIIHSTAIKA